MIKLFYAPTPAGYKAYLMLEELNIPYETQYVNVFTAVQRNSEYLKIIPTGKIPAIIQDGNLIFETGAILLSLAQKHNKFLPNENLSWFFWEVSELSPKFLQYYRAVNQKEQNNHMLELLKKDLKKLFTLLNNQLENKSYITGDFSIVDISAYGWFKYFLDNNIIPNLVDEFSNIQKWLNLMDNRESTKKMNEDSRSIFSKDKETSIEEIINFYNK